jgi:hypothetical protein
MKKNKFQDQFLAELVKVPIVQVACEKTGLSRNSVYRWRKEDKEFLKKMDDALCRRRCSCKRYERKPVAHAHQGKELSAISFWLRHRNDNYKNKLEITTKEDGEELTPSQAKIVKQALKLAKITKSKSIKNINQKKDHD